LAAALLLEARYDEAQAAVTQALRCSPRDEMARNLEGAVQEFRSGRRSRPESGADIRDAVSNR
jgi:hypothetical protein